jgi:hypothetical protein
MRIVKRTDEKIWFGGYGEEHYVYVVEKGSEDKFLGGVYVVESEADLEKYSQFTLSNAGIIQCTDNLSEPPRFLVQAR